MNNIILKSGYTFEDLAKENRVIFFDIDSTLGGNSFFHGLLSFEGQREEKRIEFEAWKAANNIEYFKFIDYIALEKTCLGMFLRTLLDTGAVPFSISSWVTSCSVGAEKRNVENFNAIDLMDLVFKGVLNEWDMTNIIGGRSLNPLDRGDFCEALAKKYGFDYLIIDDSWHVYENKKNLIEVDGNCGFQYKDYRKILEIWEK